jgi:hypothetical protein
MALRAAVFSCLFSSATLLLPLRGRLVLEVLSFTTYMKTPPNLTPEPTAAGLSVCADAGRSAAPWLRRRSGSGGCGSAFRWACNPRQASRWVFLTMLVSVLTPFLARARHVNPPLVPAITNNNVRYVVPNDEGRRAYVEAWDLQTGVKLWSKTVFTHWYIPLLSNECMHYEWIKSMALTKENLVLTSERGRVYKLNILTQWVRLTKVQPNESMEPNSRRLFPLIAAREFESQLSAPAVLSAAVAHFGC